MLSLALVAVAWSVSPVAQNVIIVGWDGCQRAHLHELIDRGRVPNLVKLSSQGALVDVTVTSGATDTKAGWSQILTGYRPETTGVYSNSRFEPIPAGLSIFERVEEAFGDDAVFTAMIVAKKGHVDNEGPRRVPYDVWLRRNRTGKNANAKPAALLRRMNASVVEQGGKKFVAVPGKPYFQVQNGMDLFKNALKTNEAVGNLALETIEREKNRRMLLFVHFARPDHDGHAHGENSREYEAGIQEDDLWTGKIVDKLRELNLYEKTRVYVVADHGFDEGLTSHKNAPYVFCATNDPTVKRDGDRADIAPTVLKRMGVRIDRLSPKLDGSPLDSIAPR